MRIRTTLLAVLVFVLAAESASGSTVTAAPMSDEQFCSTKLDYRGAPGESNYVTAEGAAQWLPDPSFGGPDCSPVVEAVHITERYANLTAGFGCTQLTPKSAVCSVSFPVTGPTIFDASFLMGDREDVLVAAPGVPTYRATVDGGSGGDTLFVNNGYYDNVTCGSGIDGVEEDAGDTIAADCEFPRRH